MQADGQDLCNRAPIYLMNHSLPSLRCCGITDIIVFRIYLQILDAIKAIKIMGIAVNIHTVFTSVHKV